MNNHPYLKIIAKNTFTLFNFVNLVLALMVLSVGSFKNLLFVGVAIANTLISVINEIKAKKIVDQLKILSEKNPIIIKNGIPTEVALDQVKKGDLLILTLGDQILFDCRLEEGAIEVNEAFLTGEQDNIAKNPGDTLLSGSFVVAGSARAKVTHALEDNFATKLETEARAIKTADSKLFSLMNNIVKYISWTLIPVGALLLWSRFRTEPNSADAVTSTVAALINMIPEGLILLTSSVLALATVRLSRRKVLVQDLYAIETLARVDTICLDKTGTLTTGRMTVHDFLLPDGATLNLKNPHTPTEKRFLRALAAILASETAENATITALKRKLLKTAKFEPTGDFAKITEIIPFSSDRKYSGIRAGNTTYLLGAIDFLTSDESLINQVKSSSGNYRVLAVMSQSGDTTSQSGYTVLKQSAPRTFQNGIPDCDVKTPENVHERTSATNGEYAEAEAIIGTEGIRNAAARGRAPAARGDGPAGRDPKSDNSSAVCELLGIIRLEDEIRPTAPKIIDYFNANDITVKIISGDDVDSVTAIAKKVGVQGLRGINLSSEKKHNYATLIRDYDIFARVTPAEKKELIKALKSAGHTVAMTGDGVNDVLAMKEADVSLAIAAGADAARRSAKFVLLDSGFESVPSIIDEGRQSINNLERSTTLFLAKTVYATILATIFVFLPFSYPFSPIEMSLLNFVCIGLPGLILALEKNTDCIKNRFTTNIIEYSVPIGFAVSFAMLILSILSHHNDFTRFELTTTSVFITFAIDLILIYWISRPLNKLRTALIFTVVAIMAAAFFVPFARDFFEFTFLTENGLIIMASIIAASFALFFLLKFLATKLSSRLAHLLHL